MSDIMPGAGPRDQAPQTGATHGLSTSEREEIARRARAIWREEGCPDGRDREHWAQAELQVLKGGVRR